MPCLLSGSNWAERAAHSKFPQSSAKVPSLHLVPHGHPRFEHGPVHVQAMREAAMRLTINMRNWPLQGWKTSMYLLLAAALLLLLPLATRAQQEEELKGIDQG